MNSALNTPPDAVALWQRLAGECVNVDAEGERGGVCIGIVDTLCVCESLVFWYKLFVELGFSVRVPKHDVAGINSATAQGRETIPSESVCYPAKLSHIYAVDVMQAGANVVFMPLFGRHARCPVNCEYAYALKFNMFGEGGDGAHGNSRGIDERDTDGVLSEIKKGDSDNGVRDGDVQRVDKISQHAGKVKFFSPELLLRKPTHMLDFPEEMEKLRQAINELIDSVLTDGVIQQVSAHVSKDEFTSAMNKAAQVQYKFNDLISTENKRALKWAHEPGKHGILLVGRPYHWDRALLHDVNYLLTNLGFSVLTSHPDVDRRKKRVIHPEVVSHGKDSGKTTLPRAMLDLERLENIGDKTEAVPFWRASKHMTRLCEAAGADADLDVVCLQSFGCGYDAASVPDARATTRAYDKPFTLLMIDDVVNTSHVRVRLRTLAAAIKQHEMRAQTENGKKHESHELVEIDKNREQNELVGNDRGYKKHSQCVQFESRNFDSENNNVIRNEFARGCSHRNKDTFQLSSEILQFAQAGDIRAFTRLDALDYEAARTSTENYCYLAALLVGRGVRICNELPKIKTLTVPYVCYGCLLDALPATLNRALESDVQVIWERDWKEGANICLHSAGKARTGCEVVTNKCSLEVEQMEDGCKSVANKCSDVEERLEQERRQLDKNKPTYLEEFRAVNATKIGILGTPPLVFEPAINDCLLETIKENGCVPVLPEPRLMLADDIAFTEQMSHFYDAGIRHVLYLMSFGCLKGHAQVRAKMPLFKKTYPDLHMTIIDFDGDASGLNRTNRVLLALSCAKEDVRK